MAIITALASTNGSFLRKSLVRAEIEKLHTICCYLKQVALVTNKQCVLTFDCDAGCYKYEDTIETLPKQLRFGAAADVLGPPSAPTKPIKKGVTFPSNQIVFYPTGIVHAGSVYISDKDYTYTYALSCAVSHVSYLRKYCYNAHWELLS